ncbi:MAG TPA: DUF6305 family protein [Bacillota bacterium]|jgi:hypothetical protein|nr:DUF6305 family protein [Bacillota bacterium]HRS21377.1 DUF6305 family protein [Clostridia bacterium]
MKLNIFRFALLILLILLIVLVNWPFTEKSEVKVFTLPGLPRPIAKVPVVITSAGQSTDTYIVNDISNQLMIRSFFMPQADDLDIEDMKTIVFTVGYSSLGVKLQGISFEDEKKRIEKLINMAKDNDMTIITVVIGGERSNDDKNEELLRIIGANTDYIIGLKGSGNEKILVDLAEKGDIPLTLVSKVSDIAEPFASAFR